MSDISSWWNADTLRADWIAGNGDLLSGDDLQSAIMISLFTDRLATAAEHGYPLSPAGRRCGRSAFLLGMGEAINAV